MKPNLKPRRQAIFDFIVAYKKRHDGNSPSIQDIGRACGISSKSLVAYHLAHLAEAGRLVLAPDGEKRHIVIVGGRWTYEEPNGH